MPDIYVAGKHKPSASVRLSRTTEDKKGMDKNMEKGEGLEKKGGKRREAVEYSEVMRDARQTTNPLAAFAVQPAVTFETQEKEEQVLLLLRRHFLTNFKWLAVWVLILLGPIFLARLPFFEVVPVRFAFITTIAWYLLAVGYFLEQFLSWYFNVYIVTDERIIDVDFYSLIYKEIASTKIDQIQDVTYQVGGAIRNLFNFGTLSIQTAGEKREFEFEDVPQPQKVTQFINELIMEEEQEKLEGRVR